MIPDNLSVMVLEHLRTSGTPQWVLTVGHFSGSKLIPVKRDSTRALDGAEQVKPCRSLVKGEHHILQELSWRQHQ